MNEKKIIKELNTCWDEDGFLEKLRYPCIIDLQQGQNLLENLKGFSIDDGENLIDRNLVRLLWYMPQFMDWQKENLMNKNNEDTYKSFIKLSGQISKEIERILGYP